MSDAGERYLGEVLRDEMIMKDSILAVLEEGPKTVPEIALALNASEYDTMLWVMGMRRYEMVIEVGGAKGDGYCQYRAIKAH
ncbi:MAG: MarR family transcriptional regulator [Verrucomicrobia bacterium]|nr:MarR family transcriptional regulator [Verrucomicrobiota bacterium]